MLITDKENENKVDGTVSTYAPASTDRIRNSHPFMEIRDINIKLYFRKFFFITDHDPGIQGGLVLMVHEGAPIT